MPTLRFRGTIEAKTPILITRVGRVNQPLTMVVMREGYPVRAPVIPGETLKGLLRALAFKIAVDAKRRADPQFSMSLEQVYEQAKGGIAFSIGCNEPGFEEGRRQAQPILSLFGAASPLIRGRLIVEPAIGRISAPDAFKLEMDLAEGVRRDPLLTDGDLLEILAPGDLERWTRQSSIVRRVASKSKALDEAKRTLSKARKVQGADIGPFVMKVHEATTEIERLKQEDDYTLAMQRPIPAKAATPAGVVFDHTMEIRDASHAEIGLFLKTIRAWSLDLRIGGGRTTGYGRLEAHYGIELLGVEERLQERAWLSIGSMRLDETGMQLDVDHPIIEDACEAWKCAEEDIQNAWALR